MINKENYEEYFLSYVDDELPAEQRLAVERFVAANPDLKEELDTLLQCRLDPEADAVFAGKSSLFQYEESFLLYVDGELDETGKKTVEELTRRHPEKGLELEQLLMTVSRPDPAVVFPDKELLYHPDRRRRVVLFRWLQAGVAAAVLAAVVLVALPPTSKPNEAGVAESATRVTAPASATAGATPNNSRAAVTPNDPSPLYSGKKTDMVRKERTTQRAGNTTASVSAGKKTRDIPDVVTTPGKTPLTPAVAVTSPKTDAGNGYGTPAVAVTPQTRSFDPTSPEKTPATTVVSVNIPEEQSSFATQALLKEAAENGRNDVAANTTQLSDMSQPPGKTKLRGLFRRVTRAFGKTADHDDDGGRQVLISAFQVALK